MKIELTDREVSIINNLLSRVQVSIDDAPEMILLREKFQDVIQEIPKHPG